MLNSENRRLKLGVTAAFLILILLNLGAWLLLRFSQRSLFAGGPLLSAAAQAALAMGLRSILRPVYAVLGYLLSGVFLFAALRLTRRRSGIFCLLHGALQLGTLVIPAARSASAAGELVDINWVLYLFGSAVFRPTPSRAGGRRACLYCVGGLGPSAVPSDPSRYAGKRLCRRRPPYGKGEPY